MGRTLSSSTTGGIQNNQETITYTVYNEQANPETGILLTDTLSPGETITSASQQPDQSGQNLAWSLGMIQGYDRASVSLTLNLVPLRSDPAKDPAQNPEHLEATQPVCTRARRRDCGHPFRNEGQMVRCSVSGDTIHHVPPRAP